MQVLLGCGALAYGLFFLLPAAGSLVLLAVGLMLVLMGVAEILPKEWTTLAGLLRIGSLAVGLLTAILVVSRSCHFG